MDDEVHIASFIVRHREESIAALDRLTADWPGLEVAAQEPTQTILLYECGGSRDLMACIDAAQTAAGVISINLVYHHAEPRGALEEALAPPD